MAKQEQAKHTPGPWRYDYEHGYCGEIIAADGTLLASFVDEPTTPNARLIASAPDLLAAAKRALNVLKAQGESIQPKNVLGALDSAIAKAEGRA
jgi:hypothetical protein